MGSTPTLKFDPVQAPVPTCSPNLMPFHIAYTGPAPMSTFFRPKPASKLPYGREDPTLDSVRISNPISTLAQSDESQTSLASSSSSTLVAASTTASSSSGTLVPSPSEDTEMQLESQELPDTPPAIQERRWVAAFRGRTIHGLEVDLPDGYSGVVLRTAETQQSAVESLNNASRRSTTTRNMKRNAREASHHDDEDDQDAPDEDASVRHLTPTGTFSSFVVWHPDFSVDENRDEYIRSLTEWTALASEIHRVENV